MAEPIPSSRRGNDLRGVIAASCGVLVLLNCSRWAVAGEPAGEPRALSAALGAAVGAARAWEDTPLVRVGERPRHLWPQTQAGSAWRPVSSAVLPDPLGAEHVVARSGSWLHANKREDSGEHSNTRPSTEPGQETLPHGQTLGAVLQRGFSAPVQHLDCLDQVPWGSVDTWVSRTRPERFRVRAQVQERALSKGSTFVPKQPRSPNQKLRSLSLRYQTVMSNVLISRHNVPTSRHKVLVSRQCGKNYLDR